MICNLAAVGQMQWLNVLEHSSEFSVLTRGMTMVNGIIYYKVSLVSLIIALQFQQGILPMCRRPYMTCMHYGCNKLVWKVNILY